TSIPRTRRSILHAQRLTRRTRASSLKSAPGLMKSSEADSSMRSESFILQRQTHTHTGIKRHLRASETLDGASIISSLRQALLACLKELSTILMFLDQTTVQ